MPGSPLQLYKYVGRSFKASPRQLGLITLTGAIVQALFSICGGLAGAQKRRAAGRPKTGVGMTWDEKHAHVLSGVASLMCKRSSDHICEQ